MNPVSFMTINFKIIKIFKFRENDTSSLESARNSQLIG